MGDFYGVDMNAKNASAASMLRGLRGLAHHPPPRAFRGHNAGPGAHHQRLHRRAVPRARELYRLRYHAPRFRRHGRRN
ncbi:MAG: hypothetical protein ACLTSX_13720 [Collinsella sp.]